jgi:DmsE family decaheme c-type cytochrome
MNRLNFPNRILLAITVAGLLTASMMAGARTYGQENHATPGQIPATVQYVGADICATCHEDVFKAVQASRHGNNLLKTKAGQESHSCETCHGPASAHVEAPSPKNIFSFKTASAKEVNEHCLNCHSSGKDHMNFSRSAHSENDLSCLSCHSAHHGLESESLLVKAQPGLCYTCHQKVRPQFNMPFHHRVEEGLIQCTDCHNAHGGMIGKQLRSAAARDSVCYTCHADKQGPFVFEHQPIKVEGCITCHSPHGSPNPRLIKTSNLNILCLKCHTASTFSGASGTPDFHNQAAQFQACTICHAAIHGSNFDRHMLK